MAMDPIYVTVREGDSFDELYLNIEKPWGTPHDYSDSVLVADIRRFFNDNADPQSAVDSFGLVELDPTQGRVKLQLTSAQTEALGRNVPLGYSERLISQSGIANSIDPTDEPQGVFLWDLREYFTLEQATILNIEGGASFTGPGGSGSQRVLITTTEPHRLSSQDQVVISGTGQAVFDGVDFFGNSLAILNRYQFEFVPNDSGFPAFVAPANTGTISVYKEDTICVGTLEVIPRISRDSVS